MKYFIKQQYANLFIHSLITILIMVGVVAGFQKTPVQTPGQTKADLRELQKLSEGVFRKGVKLYQAGKYWEATQELIVIIDYYPDFKGIDGVYFYVAEALNQIEINKPAIKAYKWLINKYPNSEYAPKAMLGLLKIYYRQKDYTNTLNYYNTILKKYSESDVLDVARYYAGQSFYQTKNWDQAILLFQRIEPNSEFYDYSIYTTALCMLKKKRIKQSRDYLLQVINLPIISGDRRKIVDDARLTIGFLYYELGYTKEAVVYFKNISESHPNYKEALLGLGWSKVKLEVYEEALEPLQRIIKLFPNTGAAEEAYFLLGQCHMKLNRYDDAIKAYEKIIELFPKGIDFAKYMQQINEELARKELTIEELETGLLLQESQLLDAIPLDGGGRQPAYLEEERKKVLKYQDALVKKIISERAMLIGMSQVIENLKEKTFRQFLRKDWRGYAEYGRARALYLKEMK